MSPRYTGASMPSVVSSPPVVAPHSAPHSAPASALTTRFLDFWLLGGASIVVWLLMVLAQPFRTEWAIDQHYRNVAPLALSLALVVNYPHFLLSYKLAYSRGRDFILRHWWQLIAVPLLLLGLLGSAYTWFELPVRDIQALVTTGRTLSAWGVNAQVVAGPRLGDVLLTAAFNLMVLTIGWHYTKQVFGCAMVYAQYDGYPLTARQRGILKWSLLTVWLMVFVHNNIDGTFRELGGFSYSAFDLPDVLAPISVAIVLGSLLLVAYAVVFLNYRVTGRWPGATMIVPVAALYVWWLPVLHQQEFYLLLVPLFHSLQYLPFVYKMEEGRLQGGPRRELRATALVGGVVLAGWLAFELVPSRADADFGTFDAWGIYFFVIAATLFINIHHYFIDNVVWRFSNPEVRRYLLR